MEANSAAYRVDNQSRRLALKPTLFPRMARPNYYQPVISRFAICALFHEGKRRKIPMTRLLDKIIEDALSDTPGWEKASEQQLRKSGSLSTSSCRD